MYNFTGSYVLEDLTPSTQYNIYVRAVRLIGESDEILEGYISNTVSVKILFTKTAATDQGIYVYVIHIQHTIYVYTGT